MGLLDFFRSLFQPGSGTSARVRCSFCADPVSTELEDLGLDGPNDCYLCRCPACGQYYGGHGYKPHHLRVLSDEEAAKYFPGVRQLNRGY